MHRTMMKPGLHRGTVGLNGAAARFVYPDDEIIIMSYADRDGAERRRHHPVVVFVDEDNRIHHAGAEQAGAVA